MGLLGGPRKRPEKLRAKCREGRGTPAQPLPGEAPEVVLRLRLLGVAACNQAMCDPVKPQKPKRWGWGARDALTSLAVPDG